MEDKLDNINYFFNKITIIIKRNIEDFLYQESYDSLLEVYDINVKGEGESFFLRRIAGLTNVEEVNGIFPAQKLRC